MLDPSIPVLLLRTDQNVFHHGTLGAIRSAGRAGLSVHAVLESEDVPAGRSRYLRRRLPWAPPVGHTGGLLGYLAAASSTMEGPALLIPMDDAGALFIARNATDLAPRFLFPAQMPSLLEALADKAALRDLCERVGVPHPETLLPRSSGEVDDAVDRLGLPLVAKWARPWRIPAGSGLRSTTIVRTRKRAHRLFAAARPDTLGQLLLQRYIAASDGSDRFFQGYFDGGSNCLMSGTGRKELASPPGAGLTVLGRWLPDPDIDGLARELLYSLGYCGVVDMDFRRDSVTGTCYLLDVNPRLGAQFRLFTGRNGLDLVRAMHLDLSFRRVPETPPQHGRTFLAENHFVRPSVRRGAATPLPVLRTLREAGELAWFAKDDPSPFFAAAAEGLSRALRGPAAPPTPEPPVLPRAFQHAESGSGR
ncbi:ATP-grasp domain-containing protein [Thermomonospora umbrina]|uniref:Putative ATP-grasp superfamily ATP-dependent carboligase n=1 Tax=Thermomonospora umbrina TaxID=111806 RepID=A0A3D9SYR6_9ACTN|nr:ATP-grasp domain-containing protein [Thermomonospora umbrina]REE97714.1 putative ATP-grasp superfamily ATP-dependent carboligase [Thermomonospora umbrina]